MVERGKSGVCSPTLLLGRKRLGVSRCSLHFIWGSKRGEGLGDDWIRTHTTKARKWCLSESQTPGCSSPIENGIVFA
jgi:hypothetical protein